MATIEGLRKKIERLAASDQKSEESGDTFEKDNEELQFGGFRVAKAKRGVQYMKLVSALKETWAKLEHELRGNFANPRIA